MLRLVQQATLQGRSQRFARRGSFVAASAVLFYSQGPSKSSDQKVLTEKPPQKDGGSKDASGWVENVQKDGLAKFLKDNVFAVDDAEESKSKEKSEPHSSSPSDAEGTASGIFDKLKEVVETVIEQPLPTTSNGTKQDEEKKISSGSEGFASLTKSITSLISGSDESNEQAVRTLISKARKNVESGDVNEQHSYEEVLGLFRELLNTLDKTFGDIDFSHGIDPTSLFYYLEYEDERKNPSWKRMMHRYQRGVDVRMVNDLFDALQFAHLAYACKEEDVREGLDCGKDKYELVWFEPNSEAGKPSHYLALKKGQSRWSNTLEVILAVRGTDTVADVITDLFMAPTDYRGGKAHDGVVTSGQYLAKKHRDMLKELLQGSGKKRIKLKLVGHSLGAASATICGIELNDDENIDVEVVGFGCPAILDRNLSEKYKNIITTVVNDSDMIPRMSGATLANVALDLMQYDWTPKARRDAEHALNELQSNASILIGESDVKAAMGFVDKAIEEYIRPGIAKAKANIPDRRMVPQLFPPGTCIHFYRDGKAISGSYAPCNFFREIDITRTMADDHLVKQGYRHLFLELMRVYHDDDHFAFDTAKEFDF